MNNRRNAYLAQVEKKSISILFSGLAPHKSADSHYPFVVNRNFYYLTGIDQANTVLVMVKGEHKADSFLFIDGFDPVKALWEGAGLSFEEASKISGINVDNVRERSTLDTFIANLLQTSRRAIFGEISTFYFDLERQSFQQKDTEAMLYSRHIKNMFNYINVKTNQTILARLRMVKDEVEVDLTKKAIAITDKALNHVMKNLQPNMYEYEVEAEYNYILNKHHVIPSFTTIAASGKNGTILHYEKNNEVAKDGDLILLDLGVNYNNYCSDISRTYPVNGKFSERQKQIYEIVLKANKETIKWVKAGITMEAFNNYGKQILIDGLKEIGLIKEDSEILKYYYHSLGHYLGLDVHDVGDYQMVIPENSILTVEPGLYIAEENIGIRIEDNILVTKDGAINLSSALIKEVQDIEAFMKK